MHITNIIKTKEDIFKKIYWFLIITSSNLCGGNIFSNVLYNYQDEFRKINNQHC